LIPLAVIVGEGRGIGKAASIDLMTTPAGLELVEDFLGRVEYGVYT